MPRENTMVYFVRPVDLPGPVKIGASQRPRRRLEDMQATSPVTLEIAAVIPGGYKKERELHVQFAEHRLHGEWFDAADVLLDFIRTVAQPPEIVLREGVFA